MANEDYHVEQSSNSQDTPSPRVLAWHSTRHYHYLMGRYSRLNMGLPTSEALRAKSYSLSPWMPGDISPRAFAVLYSLSALASTVMNKGMREQLLLPLAEDLLWGNEAHLEEQCGKIWDNAMELHLSDRGTGLWDTEELGESRCTIEGAHVLTPHDLLGGVERWILSHPDLTPNLSPLLTELSRQHLSGSGDPVLSLYLRFTGKMELVDVHRPWPLLKDDVEKQRTLLDQYRLILGQSYGEYLMGAVKMLSIHLNYAVLESKMEEDGTPGEEIIAQWSPWGVENFDDLVNLRARVQRLSELGEKIKDLDALAASLARSTSYVSLDSLEAFIAMAEEYNDEWATAAFDWEGHFLEIDRVHPRDIFLSAPQGVLHGEEVMTR